MDFAFLNIYLRCYNRNHVMLQHSLHKRAAAFISVLDAGKIWSSQSQKLDEPFF